MSKSKQTPDNVFRKIKRVQSDVNRKRHQRDTEDLYQVIGNRVNTTSCNMWVTSKH